MQELTQFVNGSIRRWTRFVDVALQKRMLERATEMGAVFHLDPDGRCWYEEPLWTKCGDPDIAALDETLGPDWVAVYADEPALREERRNELAARSVPFVEWHASDGVFLVVKRSACPDGWEFA